MNKSELVESVAKLAELSKKDSERAVSAVFESISNALVKEEKVVLVGFGTFETRRREARTGRNPATKEVIKIAASKSPAFKAGKGLKDRVNKSVKNR